MSEPPRPDEAAIAHEMRNALAGIRSAVEVIGQRFPAGSEERLALEEVRRRVADLNEMAHELVRLARTDSDRSPRRAISASALARRRRRRRGRRSRGGSGPAPRGA